MCRYALSFYTFAISIRDNMTEINIAAIRKEYRLRSFLENEADPDPIKQFQHWWNETLRNGIEELNAMTLATCNHQGRPSAKYA